MDTAHTYRAHRPRILDAMLGPETVTGRLILVTKAALGAATASIWQALAGALVLLLAATAGGMLLGGNEVYVGPTYNILKMVPGGMHTYGVALGALLMMLVYGYGQQHAGNGAVLRLALALTAAWYVGWLLMIIGTYAYQGALYSWSAITTNLFIAAVANLVARNVPPDRR